MVTAYEAESVTDAARRMSQLHVGDLIVVAEQLHGLPRPIGIVTDRDLVVHVLARPDRDPATMTISDVMSRELVTVSEDDDIERVVVKMREHSIRRIPVIDRSGGLQGVLSIDDVLGWMRDQVQAATKLLEHQGRGPELAHAK